MMARTLLRRLGRDASGATLVEFGLLAPMFIWATLSGLELTNMVLARQKVERLAATSADLFARNKLPPNEGQVLDAFKAVNLIAKPFDGHVNGRVWVTGVIGTADGSTNVVGNKVAWQRCSGLLAGKTSEVGSEWTTTTKFEDGPDVALPNGIALGAAQMVVVAEVAFKYVPMIKSTMLPGMPGDGVIRETAVYPVRASPYTSITPLTGATRTPC